MTEKKEKLLVSMYPHLVKEWHPTKNGNLTPDMFYSGSTKKVWWLCPKTCEKGCLHEFQSSIVKRCGEGTGCTYCCKPVKKICEHMSIAYTHPEVAKEWHPTKNGSLKPTEITSGSGLKVWWLCPKTCSHGCLHEYQSIIAQRCTKNSQCQYCIANPMKMCVHMSIVYTHPEIAKLWHPTKNGDLKPSDITSGSHKKVWWLCPKTCNKNCPHEFERVVYHMTTTDTMCSFCTNRKFCEHMSILYTHPEIAKEWHPTKNGNLQPINVTYGCNTQVWWKCSKNSNHGDWENQVLLRCINDYGCPSCSKGGISRGQVQWLEHLQNQRGIDIIFKGGKHNKEKSFRFNKKLYRADGFYEKEKIVFEYLGCWHHGCPKCFDSTLIHPWKRISMCELFKDFEERKRVFEENGYTVESIWECEWKESRSNKSSNQQSKLSSEP